MRGRLNAKELHGLFRQVEERSKEPEYRKALEDTHAYLVHKERKKLVLAE